MYFAKIKLKVKVRGITFWDPNHKVIQVVVLLRFLSAKHAAIP